MPEFEARTVKEAIAKGLEALNLTQDDADIEVIDEGRSGVFGVGGKSAVVRIAPKATENAAKAATLHASESDEASVETDVSDRPTFASVDETAAPEETEVSPVDAETQRVLAISADFLQGLLDRMELKAGVEALILAGEDETIYRLNITGEDLGILIGRRAETLDAFQYLTRLVVNQQTHRWYRIEVDVENYKQRREQSLQRLARNMADRAVSEGRTIILEPMPPRERRLIHLALRDREDVHTESVGEGDSRKVTIVPNS